jgi:hypothetical protein
MSCLLLVLILTAISAVEIGVNNCFLSGSSGNCRFSYNYCGPHANELIDLSNFVFVDSLGKFYTPVGNVSFSINVTGYVLGSGVNVVKYQKYYPVGIGSCNASTNGVVGDDYGNVVSVANNVIRKNFANANVYDHLANWYLVQPLGYPTVCPVLHGGGMAGYLPTGSAGLMYTNQIGFKSSISGAVTTYGIGGTSYNISDLRSGVFGQLSINMYSYPNYSNPVFFYVDSGGYVYVPNNNFSGNYFDYWLDVDPWNFVIDGMDISNTQNYGYLKSTAMLNRIGVANTNNAPDVSADRYVRLCNSMIFQCINDVPYPIYGGVVGSDIYNNQSNYAVVNGSLIYQGPYGNGFCSTISGTIDVMLVQPNIYGLAYVMNSNGITLNGINNGNAGLVTYTVNYLIGPPTIESVYVGLGSFQFNIRTFSGASSVCVNQQCINITSGDYATDTNYVSMTQPLSTSTTTVIFENNYSLAVVIVCGFSIVVSFMSVFFTWKAQKKLTLYKGNTLLQ